MRGYEIRLNTTSEISNQELRIKLEGLMHTLKQLPADETIEVLSLKRTSGGRLPSEFDDLVFLFR